MTLADVLMGAFRVFTEPGLFGAMAIGLSLGMVFGAAPGLSGKMGLLLLLPLLFDMDPAIGVVLLLSMHSVVHTGGSVPSILVGVPGGAPEAATVLDGFAMAKKGQAAEALGASMAASGIGGALGALCYFALLPVFASLGRIFGAPEYLLLALLGLCAVSTLSQGSVIKGFAMGALGLLAGTVGLDYATGTPRYTFGQLELWDGLDMLLMITGLFAVPELIDMARKKTLLPSGEEAAATCTYRALFRGMMATWHHRWLTLRTTAIGIVIGMMPGLGAEVASWLAYGHAVQSAKDKTRFGKGAVEGVIAPETANNSKEGGSLLPTVAFGIPGSSTMALMIAGLAILGIPVGTTMLEQHGDIAILIGWSVLWSNLAAVLAFLAVLPLVGKIVYLRIDYLAPTVLAIAVAGTLIEQTGWVPLVVLFLISAFGCYLTNADWPRAPFLLGFIMGRLAEINLIKTSALYGWSAFTRWPTLLLLALLVYLVVRGLRTHKVEMMQMLQRSDLVVAAALLLLFLAAGLTALFFPYEARLLPLLAGGLGVVATGTMLTVHWLAAPGNAPMPSHMPWRLLVGFALFLALVPLIGILPASAAYAGLHALIELRMRWWRAALLAGVIGATIWLLFGYWLRQPVMGAL
jgi:putative tricarboxylic transport membrane protein